MHFHCRPGSDSFSLNLRVWLLCYIGIQTGLSGWVKGEDLPAVTGVREWRFVDGSKKRYRLRTIRADIAHLSGDGLKTTAVPFNRFVPDQRELLESIAKGSIELVEPRGVETSVESPSGKINWRTEQQTSAVVGAERVWTKKDGKTAKGALLNIADDEISILAEETAWKLSGETLCEADQHYVDRVIKGLEPVFPWRVQFPLIVNNSDDLAPVWGSISGERFFKKTKEPISFEEAVQIAAGHVKSQLDEKFWQMTFAREEDWSIPDGQATKLTGLKADLVRRGYLISFSLDGSKIDKAEKVFPHFNNREGTYYVYLFDDGEFPNIKFIPLLK